MAEENQKDFLGMSDADFLNEAPPVVEEPVQAAVEENPVEEPAVVVEEKTPEQQDTSSKEVEDSVKADLGEDILSGNNASDAEVEASKPPLVEDKAAKVEEPKKDDVVVPPAGSEPEPEVAAPDYEASYKTLMEPLKANGKVIEIKSPEELRQLAQMGMNYTRKMQDIAPHRKALLMLQDNGLLDEGELSFLIDIKKKNPEAIKKLLKDSGIDPMEIDIAVEPTYTAGSHKVTDQEVAFRETLETIGSDVAGKATLQIIDKTWDDASKEMLLSSPAVMTLVHEQRENGIYDRITAEIDRRKTLGQISTNTPFLKAYTEVGDQMIAQGLIQDPEKPKVEEKKEPVIAAVRTEKPKEGVKNTPEAEAAAVARTTPKTAQPFINPLAMSDEDFMKLPGNRG